MMGPLRWLKTLFAMVRHYKAEQKDLFALGSKVDDQDAKTQELVELIRSRTEINVDVGFRGDPNTVIVLGRYRDGDFIQTYQLRTDSFGQLVDHLREMEEHGHVCRVDAPPQMKHFIEHLHHMHGPTWLI